jgi:hypothetical protein
MKDVIFPRDMPTVTVRPTDSRVKIGAIPLNNNLIRFQVTALEIIGQKFDGHYALE